MPEPRGAPLVNSEERRAARRERRERERAEKRERRLGKFTLEEVADLDNLYRAAGKAARGVRWKASVQRYEKDVLLNVARTRRQLLAGEDVRRGFYHFDLYERGKLRHISSVHFSERVPQKSLNQNVLMPAIDPSLVPGCTANRVDMGNVYAVKLLKEHLARHYREHGTEGYILLFDFKNYFGSIQHASAHDHLSGYIADERVRALAHAFVGDRDEVGLGLGGEPNQTVAVSLPTRIDHHVIECCGVEAYGRYMDDGYAIHMSKDHLWGVLSEIEWLADELGLALNRDKTQIVKLSHGFTWLKKKISYGENGRIVVRPSREAIARERRKLKKLAALWKRGEVPIEAVEQHYQSWRGGMLRLDAHERVLRMDALYRQLFNRKDGSGGVALCPQAVQGEAT